MKKWSMMVWLVTMAASPAAVGDSPYLPASGPAPLRFSNPVVRKATAIQLAPLATIESHPAPSGPSPHVQGTVPATTLADTNVPSGTPQPPLPIEPAVPVNSDPLSPPTAFTPVVTNGVEFVRPDGENLTPQMFMRFFSGRPGTNASGISIIAPMPFIPPALPAPSSTATFQTTPPSKP